MKRLTIGLAALALLALCLWLARTGAPAAPQAVPVVDRPASPEQPQPTELSTMAPTEGSERAPIATSAEVVATKPAEFALIRVLVLDEATKAPLRGVSVSASYDSGRGGGRVVEAQGTRGKPFETLTTGLDGRVEIEVPPLVEAKVNASGSEIDAGFEQVAVPGLTAGEVRELVMHLPVGTNLVFWMQLLAEETHAPIAHASVDVVRPGYATLELATDEHGRVMHEGRTWGRSKLRVQAERRAEFFVVPDRGHATVETALVIEVPLAATLRVKVEDAVGAPVRGALVSSTTPGYNLRPAPQSGMAYVEMPDPRWTATTDGAGVAELMLPSRVPIRVSLVKPRKFQPADPVVLEPGETRALTWKLTNGCELTGVVLDQENSPVVGRAIWLRPAEQRSATMFNDYSSGPTRTEPTDSTGRFHFDNVQPGDWSVGPSVPKIGKPIEDNDVAALAQYVRVEADETVVDVIVRVDRGLFISGRLLGSDGKSTKGGHVAATDLDRRLFLGAQVARDDASFRIGPLMAGTYEVRGTVYGDAASDPVAVEAGTSGLALRSKAGAILGGRITGRDGAVLDGRVAVGQRGPKATSVHYPSTRNGTFRVTGLEPGLYDLAAITTDGGVGVLEQIELREGETRADVVIVTAPGGSVRVRHEGPGKYIGISILQGEVLIASDGLERDATRVFGAPLGSVIVRAHYREDERRVVDRIVQIEVGKTVNVVFEKGAR